MRCAVLGDPIAHSLSPVLHRAGYAAVGLDWTYDACRVPAGGLPAFLAGIGSEGLRHGWRGLSLTMPLKREAVALCDELSPEARRVGAANTLVLVEGRVHGDNTDVPGAVIALREAGVTEVEAMTVLGGGATATSVGLACVDLGARSIRLLVRSPERAAETAEVLRREPGVRVEVIAALEVGGSAAGVSRCPARPSRGSSTGGGEGELVVNTLPASAQTPDLVAATAAAATIFDVIYDPWPTPLAAAALERGQVLVGGLDLLVAQAVLQFEQFTGRQVAPAVLRAAGEAALDPGLGPGS